MGLFDKFKRFLAEEDIDERADEADIEQDDTDEEAEEETEVEELGLFKKLFGRFARENDEDEEPSREQLHQNISSAGYRVNEAEAVQDFCEQLVDVSSHMNEIAREYKLVTKYLTDIQRIEELPKTMADEINEIAAKIETLDKNRQMYIQSENLLPVEQYNLIAAHEEEVVTAIKNLNDMEMRDSALKNDMGYLAGEKEDLKYMRNEYAGNISKVRGIIITVLIMFLLTCGMLVIYTVMTRESITLYAAIAGVIAMLAFAIAYVYYIDLRRAFKENEAKLKRAISLENKVKVKYINNVNTVDYIYSKYGVNSGKELEYCWQQYNTMVRDAEKYNKANNNMKRYCDELVLKLDKIGVEDSDVWTKQTSALCDRREMVEIKHSLNVRRKKLRDNMLTCDKIKSNAITALKAAIDDNPVMEQFIKKQLAPYGIRVE